MRRVLIPLLLALNSACTTTGGQKPAPSMDIEPCDCRPYPKPEKIDIEDINPVKYLDPVTGEDKGWLLDNQSYINNGKVWAQFERYIGETESGFNYWWECVNACNAKIEKIKGLAQ